MSQQEAPNGVDRYETGEFDRNAIIRGGVLRRRISALESRLLGGDIFPGDRDTYAERLERLKSQYGELIEQYPEATDTDLYKLAKEQVKQFKKAEDVKPREEFL